MSDPKVILIDGNSLIYRAFFALPTTLALPSGQVTNAVYGFTSMLIRLLLDEKPDVVAVAFDSRGPTRRREMYAEYKAHREAAPDDLHSQFPLVREVLAALRIPTFETPGHEADDVLATLARKTAAGGNHVLVVTGDRDAFQLITNRQIQVMTTRRGITDIVVYDRDKVIERYGIPPEQIPDFLGLKGDPSDNIPGVPGVGDKTAAKLIQEFGSVENIYGHLEEVASDRLRQSLAENHDRAIISKQLAVLQTDLDLDLDLSQYRVGEWDEREVREVFTRLQFRTLLERLAKLRPQEEAPLPELAVSVQPVGVSGLADRLEAEKPAQIGVAVSTERRDKRETVYIAVAWQEKDGYVVGVASARSRDELTVGLAPALRPWLTGEEPLKAVFDYKEAVRVAHAVGLPLEDAYFDPMIAAYLLAPVELDYSPENLCAKYLGRRLEPVETAEPATGRRAAASVALTPIIKAQLEREGLDRLFAEVEMPLALVLARMEDYGVGLDRRHLAKLGDELQARLDELQKAIFKLAGEELNLNSPTQLGRILFDKLGLEPGRKTKAKAAYATDVSVLMKLRDEHPIVPLVLNYRELAKLKSTYIDALPRLVNPATGRLHTTFHQTVTATGRLSSSNPNLQNIPVRTELGRRIREAFVPAHPDEKLLVADYSQIELRLLAHLSDDPALVQLFTAGADIHGATASEVFGVPPDEVTSELRRRAKAVNFGIIYGISPFGLSQQLDISTEEAKAYIDRYFQRFPAVHRFLQETIARAREQEFVTTILGRRRYLPELASTSYRVRAFGERVATNAPLQGSAADIIKLAMINIDRRLRTEGLQTRMVLQVHDELVFEVPPFEEQVAESLVRQEMEGAYRLKVPLSVDISFGANWGQAK